MDSGDWKEWPLHGPPKLRYTLQEVATWLDISADTLRGLIEQGRFPRGHKVSPQSSPTWTGADLAAWLHMRDRWYPEPDSPDTGRHGAKPDEPRRKRDESKSES